VGREEGGREGVRGRNCRWEPDSEPAVPGNCSAFRMCGGNSEDAKGEQSPRNKGLKARGA
jgi:hypothetical protein